MLSYGRVSLGFLTMGLLALIAADLGVTVLHPGAELARLWSGILHPDLLAVGLRGVVLTVAFAVLGVSAGAAAGFGLALVFHRVRYFCAAIRSVHELFWALLLMQVLGPSPAAGLLAIAIPYAGIFAKVFAEMIEETDLAADRVLPPGTGVVSRFAFARAPVLARPIGNYLLYRLECGLRSTLVLGFIGLPTMGFELESYFRQGHYAEAAGYVLVFYVLISSRRLWARPATLPFLLLGSAASLAWLAPAIGGGSVWAALGRFLFHDIVPRPLRPGGGDLLPWLWAILCDQALPGLVNTLVVSQLAMIGMAVLGLLLFPLVAARFTGRIGRPLGRVLLVVLRSTPEYMAAYVLLQLLGPSMLPAVIALTVHNGGVLAFLMGRQADDVALRADAPRGLDLYCWEVLPRLYGQFLAYVLYRWEIIVRESAIFGMLGVRTLGFHVDAAIQELHLDVAVVLILVTGGLSMLIDAASHTLRRRLRVADKPVRLSLGN